MVRGKNQSGQIRSIKFKNKINSFSTLPFDNTLLNAPEKPGVYLLGCGDKINYIGQSKHLKSRLNQHRRDGMDACYAKFKVTKTVSEAKKLEKQLVGTHCPPDNKLLKKGCKKGFWEEFFG